jgi:hypothetical protein
MTAYRVPPRLAHVVPVADDGLASAVFLMRLPDGPPVVLHGSAAWIWLLAADGEPGVAADVAELVGRPPAEMADEVNHFLDDLVGRGLIEVDPRRDETSA